MPAPSEGGGGGPHHPPWLFGFAIGGAQTWLFVTLGVGVIAYSMLTDYELGLVKVIPMQTHLGLDIAVGILLAISPWLLVFSELVWAPHLILGLAAIGAGLFTRTLPRRTVVEQQQQQQQRPRRAA